MNTMGNLSELVTSPGFNGMNQYQQGGQQMGQNQYQVAGAFQSIPQQQQGVIPQQQQTQGVIYGQYDNGMNNSLNGTLTNTQATVMTQNLYGSAANVNAANVNQGKGGFAGKQQQQQGQYGSNMGNNSGAVYPSPTSTAQNNNGAVGNANNQQYNSAQKGYNAYNQNNSTANNGNMNQQQKSGNVYAGFSQGQANGQAYGKNAYQNQQMSNNMQVQGNGNQSKGNNAYSNFSKQGQQTQMYNNGQQNQMYSNGNQLSQTQVSNGNMTNTMPSGYNNPPPPTPGYPGSTTKTSKNGNQFGSNSKQGNSGNKVGNQNAAGNANANGMNIPPLPTNPPSAYEKYSQGQGKATGNNAGAKNNKNNSGKGAQNMNTANGKNLNNGKGSGKQGNMGGKSGANSNSKGGNNNRNKNNSSAPINIPPLPCAGDLNTDFLENFASGKNTPDTSSSAVAAAAAASWNVAAHSIRRGAVYASYFQQRGAQGGDE